MPIVCECILRQKIRKKKKNTLNQEKVLNQNRTRRGNLAHTIVRRHYTESDVEKARYLQNKFDNVDTIASDSCFHLGYMGQAEDRDDNDKPIMVDKRISHHFDFKIDGGIHGQDNGHRDHDFGYAYFRDELKAQDELQSRY